jgi:hydrogenase/urease accessory protein HupE
MRLFHCFLLFLVGWGLLAPVSAHQLRPALVTVSFGPDASVKLRIETNAEARLAGIGPQHDNTDDSPQAGLYRKLRALPPADLQQRFAAFAADYAKGLTLEVADARGRWQPLRWVYDGIEVPEVGDIRLSRKSLIRYHGVLPPGSQRLRWRYAAEYGDAVVSFEQPGQEPVSYWLSKGETSPEYPLDQAIAARPWSRVAADYLELGFIHILPRGVDHILFVLGLFLLSRQLKPLLWQVTAFTVAHTITLALTIYGYIDLPPSIVEPAIALSIAYVGIENLLTRELHAWRVVIVFLFGLLHGMGFAGVLTELGLPQNEFVTALISFNVGVELGQLAVITLAFLAVFWLRHNRQAYRRRVVVPGSLGIAIMGLYWTVERLGWI